MGYFTFLEGNIVTRNRKNQNVATRSSEDAEYRVMTHTTSELTWLQKFLQELSFIVPTSIPLLCDNQATMHIESNPVFHERIK